MAMPPTRIYRYLAGEPADTFRALREAGLLAEATLAREAEAVRELRAFIARADDELARKPPGWTGPNMDDRIAGFITGWLNAEGRRLADELDF